MARLQPHSRTVELMVRASMDPKQAARNVAKVHRRLVSEAEAANKRALGAVPPSETFVDGRKGAPLESVKLSGGTILTKFESIGEVLEFIDAMLIMHSPTLSGAYARSHRLFADGTEVDGWEQAGTARVYMFISTLPYSRKIERGESDQAPEGVYEGVAALAKNRYGNLVAVRFTFESTNDVPVDRKSRGSAKRAAQKVNRFPAIKITLR